MSKFVILSKDPAGVPALRECGGAEATAIAIIELVRAGHTGINNYIADPEPVRQAPRRPEPRAYFAQAVAR